MGHLRAVRHAAPDLQAAGGRSVLPCACSGDARLIGNRGDRDDRGHDAAAQTCIRRGKRCLHIERSRGDRVRRWRESQARVALGHANERAACDRGHAIVLEERAVRDRGDLEVGDLGPVGDVSGDDKAARGLLIFSGRSVGDTGGVGHGSHIHRRRGDGRVERSVIGDVPEARVRRSELVGVWPEDDPALRVSHAGVRGGDRIERAKLQQRAPRRKRRDSERKRVPRIRIPGEQLHHDERVLRAARHHVVSGGLGIHRAGQRELAGSQRRARGGRKTGFRAGRELGRRGRDEPLARLQRNALREDARAPRRVGRDRSRAEESQALAKPCRVDRGRGEHFNAERLIPLALQRHRHHSAGGDVADHRIVLQRIRTVADRARRAVGRHAVVGEVDPEPSRVEDRVSEDRVGQRRGVDDAHAVGAADVDRVALVVAGSADLVERCAAADRDSAGGVGHPGGPVGAEPDQVVADDVARGIGSGDLHAKARRRGTLPADHVAPRAAGTDRVGRRRTDLHTRHRVPDRHKPAGVGADEVAQHAIQLTRGVSDDDAAAVVAAEHVSAERLKRCIVVAESADAVAAGAVADHKPVHAVGDRLCAAGRESDDVPLQQVAGGPGSGDEDAVLGVARHDIAGPRERAAHERLIHVVQQHPDQVWERRRASLIHPDEVARDRVVRPGAGERDADVGIAGDDVPLRCGACAERRGADAVGGAVLDPDAVEVRDRRRARGVQSDDVARDDVGVGLDEHTRPKPGSGYPADDVSFIGVIDPVGVGPDEVDVGRWRDPDSKLSVSSVGCSVKAYADVVPVDPVAQRRPARKLDAHAVGDRAGKAVDGEPADHAIGPLDVQADRVGKGHAVDLHQGRTLVRVSALAPGIDEDRSGDHGKSRRQRDALLAPLSADGELDEPAASEIVVDDRLPERTCPFAGDRRDQIPLSLERSDVRERHAVVVRVRGAILPTLVLRGRVGRRSGIQRGRVRLQRERLSRSSVVVQRNEPRIRHADDVSGHAVDKRPAHADEVVVARGLLRRRQIAELPCRDVPGQDGVPNRESGAGNVKDRSSGGVGEGAVAGDRRPVDRQRCVRERDAGAEPGRVSGDRRVDDRDRAAAPIDEEPGPLPVGADGVLAERGPLDGDVVRACTGHVQTAAEIPKREPAERVSADKGPIQPNRRPPAAPLDEDPAAHRGRAVAEQLRVDDVDGAVPGPDHGDGAAHAGRTVLVDQALAHRQRAPGRADRRAARVRTACDRQTSDLNRDLPAGGQNAEVARVADRIPLRDDHVRTRPDDLHVIDDDRQRRVEIQEHRRIDHRSEREHDAIRARRLIRAHDRLPKRAHAVVADRVDHEIRGDALRRHRTQNDRGDHSRHMPLHCTEHHGTRSDLDPPLSEGLGSPEMTNDVAEGNTNPSRAVSPYSTRY